MSKDYKKLLDLFHEFDAFLRRIYGLYMDGIAGFDFLARHIETEHNYYRDMFKDKKELSSTEFLDTLGFSHDKFVGGDLAKISIHFGKKGDVKRRNIRNGENQINLGSMCLVMIYTYWETYFRKQLSNALNVKTEELKFDIWGDLRIIRTCILHKKNILYSDDYQNIKMFKRFKADEEVIIDESIFTEIFLCLLEFRNWVHEQSVPKTYLRIPLKS